MIDQLVEGLQGLEEVLRSLSVRSAHFIPDVVSVGFGREIYESSLAVRKLAHSETPRMANICARTAFEAATDVMFLVSRNDYDHWGACARVGELLDWEYASDLSSKVPLDSTMTDHLTSFDASAAVQQEAYEWERQCPGKGDILHNAFAHMQAVRANRPYLHWSERSRSKLVSELGGQNDSVMMRSWYNLLSIQTHAAPRIFTDFIDVQSSDAIQLNVTIQSSEERERIAALGIGTACASVQAAIVHLPALVEAG